MQQTHRVRRGGAAVEFALVLPILLALLFGIMEYGWMFLQNLSVVAAVREGARLGVTYAAEDTPTPDAAAAARTEAALTAYGFPPGSATITTTYAGASPEETLTVTAQMPYAPLIGLVGVPAQLNGSITMLLEQQE